MADAFTAAFAVLAEAALAWALASAALRGRGRRGGVLLAVSVVAGIAVGLGAAVTAAARGVPAADVALSLSAVRHLLPLALLAGAFVLRGLDDPPAREGAGRRAAADTAALAAGVAWAVPEAAALGLALRDGAVLAGSWRGVALGAAAAVAAAILLGLSLRRLADRVRLERLAPSGLLAALFALKMCGGGAAAVELPPLARGLAAVASRTIHDGLHLGFVLLQLPDHPYLREPVYQLILSFLEPLPHALVAAVALAAPVGVAWRAFARRVEPGPPSGARPPEARLLRAAFRARTRLSGVAYGAAVAAVAAAVLSSYVASEELYDPVPEPVVDDGRGSVVVPVGGPLAGPDRRLRKYVWSHDGRAVTFFTVRRADGTIAAALDLCEVCQPKGYAQLGAGHVYCKYCKTPIPIGTVGQAGGCNPLPLASARLDGAVLRIAAAELRAQYARAMRAQR